MGIRRLPLFLLLPVMVLALTGPRDEGRLRAGEPVRLTRDGQLKRDPIFWPTGESLLYTVHADSGRMRIMRLNLEDGSVTRFHEREDLSDREPSISADGAVVAYNEVDGLSTHIIVHDQRSGTKVRVPYQGVADWAHWPALDPAGTVVVFTEGAGPLLSYDFRRDEGKQALRQLTTAGAEYGDLMPRFSPDGKRIVFVSRRDNDFEIYVMDADGSNQQRLTNRPGIEMHPSFSPDGRRIAFTSNRDGNHEVYTMNVDGSDVRRLTNHPERDDHAAWHPAGDKLVVVSERDGLFDLYLIE